MGERTGYYASSRVPITLSLLAHTRVLPLLRLSSSSSMATPHMAQLYRELQRAFEARPTDLAKTGKLLTKLKVRWHRVLSTDIPRISWIRLAW